MQNVMSPLHNHHRQSRRRGDLIYSDSESALAAVTASASSHCCFVSYELLLTLHLITVSHWLINHLVNDHQLRTQKVARWAPRCVNHPLSDVVVLRAAVDMQSVWDISWCRRTVIVTALSVKILTDSLSVLRQMRQLQLNEQHDSSTAPSTCSRLL